MHIVEIHNCPVSLKLIALLRFFVSVILILVQVYSMSHILSVKFAASVVRRQGFVNETYAVSNFLKRCQFNGTRTI